MSVLWQSERRMSSKAVVWSKRLAAWRSGNESAAGFCRSRGLSYSQFVYWQRRSVAAQGALVPVVVDADRATANGDRAVELTLPNGTCVRLTLPLAEVAALVRSLC
jgi:hypothetical protein